MTWTGNDADLVHRDKELLMYVFANNKKIIRKQFLQPLQQWYCKNKVAEKCSLNN